MISSRSLLLLAILNGNYIFRANNEKIFSIGNSVSQVYGKADVNNSVRVAANDAATLEVKNGFGKHVATLTPAEIVRCLQVCFSPCSHNYQLTSVQSLYASIIIYNLALTCIKISIILLYLRLFITQTAKRICYSLLAIVIAYGVETFFAGIFTCTPVAFFWNSKIHGGKCVDKTTLYYANAGISIVTDVALFFIPFVFLRLLMMPRLQKLLVMLIVAFGGL
jgi:hypothetical protein